MNDRNLHNWCMVKKALEDGSIYKADLQTLKSYLHYINNAPTTNNPAALAIIDRADQTARELISKKQYSQRTLRSGILAVVLAALGIPSCILATQSLSQRKKTSSLPTQSTAQPIQSATNSTQQSSSIPPPNK